MYKGGLLAGVPWLTKFIAVNAIAQRLKYAEYVTRRALLLRKEFGDYALHDRVANRPEHTMESGHGQSRAAEVSDDDDSDSLDSVLVRAERLSMGVSTARNRGTVSNNIWARQKQGMERGFRCPRARPSTPIRACRC